MTRFNILDLVDDDALSMDTAVNAALKYLSSDDKEELLRINGWDEFEADDIYDLLDEGILDPRDVLDAALQYLSTDEIDDLIRINGWDEGIEWDDDDDDEEDDDDVYYDPVDGYRDTEGFHNSIEEAEDDYYENHYKVNIPEDDFDDEDF